jgi:signal transduction histidine kinase
VKFVQLFRRQPRSFALLEALFLLAIVGVADLETGYEASLTLFYIIPILLVVFWWDRWTISYGVAALAALVWCWADMAAGHPYAGNAVQLWEIAVHSVFFFLVATAGCVVKKQSDAANARISLLEHAQRLEQQIVEVSEYEQRRIGQDLHDGLCQYLAALGCSASALKSDLEQAGLPRFAAAAEDLAQLLRAGISQTRNLARGLMPLHMDGGGLGSALEALTKSCGRLLNVECVLSRTGETIAATDGKATHLYRIAQEAINNATRHGKAQRIEVSLSSNPSAVVLSIADDGIGISKTAKNLNGMGLSIMRYRSNLIGGELLIEERTNGGTVVCCTTRQEALT